MSNVVDITEQLNLESARHKLGKLLGLVQRREKEILADPLGAVRELEQRAATDILRMRKAIEDAYWALRPSITVVDENEPIRPTNVYAETEIRNRRAAEILANALL